MGKRVKGREHRGSLFSLFSVSPLPLLALLFLFVLLAPALIFLQPVAFAQTVVTAVQVNGTWRLRNNEFKIWALGHQKLRVEFSGVYEYNSPQGPTANMGEGSGIATIEGDTAIFKPDGAEDECKITMKFTGGRLVVTQKSICGFGHNVTADGTYRRVSSSKPRFGEQ